MHTTRRDRLRERLTRAGLDALLVTTPVNVRYLTGFTGSVGRLLLSGDAQLLVVDDRYGEQAAGEAPDLDLLVTREDDWLGERVQPGRLGVESHELAWDAVRAVAERVKADVVPAPHHVEALREVKDDGELAALRRACAITDAAFADLLAWVRPGLTEREVARRLHHALTGLGADDRAFAAIVASGPNSARPHHRAGERVLADGELVKVDFGALLDGYHADMTRMVALGEPDRRLLEVFDVVRAAQEAGLAALTEGVAAGAVDAACREVIAEAGYGEAFPHGTGHGVGLRIHEAPALRPEARATLRSGMTITVEPGVYLPGVGGVRIEDTVAVTAGGPDVLTRTTKSLARP